MTTQITPLPTPADRRCADHTMQSMAKHLVPFDQAEEDQPIAFGAHFIQPPQYDTLRMVDSGELILRSNYFLKFPVTRKSFDPSNNRSPVLDEAYREIAINLINDKEIQHLLSIPWRNMNRAVDGTDAIYAIFTPGAIVTLHKDWEDSHEWATNEEFACQENVTSLVGLITDNPKSAHERLAATASLNSAISILNALYSPPDQDGNPVTFVTPKIW